MTHSPRSMAWPERGHLSPDSSDVGCKFEIRSLATGKVPLDPPSPRRGGARDRRRAAGNRAGGTPFGAQRVLLDGVGGIPRTNGPGKR